MPSILNIYKQRLRASKNIAEPHWSRAIDNYKHYLGRLDVGGISEKDYPFSSKMVLPLSYEIVEKVLPRVIGKDPEFSPIAIEPNDVPYENTARIAIDMQYNNPKLELLGEPIYLKLVKGIKECLITGNVVWRAFWRRETRKHVIYTATLKRTGHENEDIKKVMEAANRLKKDIPDIEKEITYGKKFVESPFLDDFDIRLVPFFHFYPDVYFSEPGRMRYKIERTLMTPDELFDEAETFGYDKAVMDEIRRIVDRKEYGFTSELGKDFLVEYNDLFANVNDSVGSTDDDKIPLLIVDKMWEGGEKVHVIVNEKYVLTGDEGMPNPYDVKKDPFIFGVDVSIPHSYFGRGEVDAIKKLEDGATDIYNMRFDNLIQSMLNYWLVNKNFIAEGDEFLPIPNTITSVTDIDRAVRIISGKDVTASAYREAQELIALIDRVSGTEDYVKGGEGQTLAGRTYGGMRLVQEMANARFIVKSRLIEKMSLKALGYFILEFSRQFINKDRVARIVGETGEKEELLLKAADLKTIKGFMDIKVIPNSSMVIDQQAEALKMNAIADRFLTQKGPFANIPEEVYDKFLLKYLMAYGITDAVYWVRERRKARLEAQTAEKKATKGVNNKAGAEALAKMGMLGNAPEVPPLTTPVVQSDQVANIPAPLEQLVNAENLPPVENLG
jgi:hypothetical protein